MVSFSETVKVRKVQFRPDLLVVYDQCVNVVDEASAGVEVSDEGVSGVVGDMGVWVGDFLSETRRKNLKEGRKLAYQYNKLGILSRGARKRMGKAIDILVMGAKKKTAINPKTGKQFDFKLSFVTLTISSSRIYKHSFCRDNLLQPFLRWLRRTAGANAYVWKAELQERGQIHYHLITDVFVDYRVLRKKWNELQEKNGILDDFKEKYGHSDPNSTDIHAVWKDSQVKNYLKKYFWKDYFKRKDDQGNEIECFDQEAGKSEEDRIIDGKAWDCSVNLKKGSYLSVEIDMKFEIALTRLVESRQVEKIDLDSGVSLYRCVDRQRSIYDFFQYDDYFAIKRFYENIVEMGYDEEIVQEN